MQGQLVSSASELKCYTQHPGGTETIPLIASSSTIAAAFVSCLVMMVGMPLGRRNCILIGNVLITIGGVIQAASYSVPQIIVARVLCVCHSPPCPFLLL